jgi:hypothetical protein
MPMMLISLVSNIDPQDVVEPTGVDTRAHSVATHDSLKQASVPGKAWEDVKSVGSGSMESLLEVAAGKVCW